MLKKKECGNEKSVSIKTYGNIVWLNDIHNAVSGCPIRILYVPHSRYVVL